MVRVEAANSGSVRFVNCAFWGPCNQIAKISGRGTVGFSDCTFVQWDREKKGVAALQATGGTLMVRGCEFQQDKVQIELWEEVHRAVISDNTVRGEVRINNHTKARVVVANNLGD